MTTQAILKKIANIESEIQKLKMEAYFSLPKKDRISSKYSEKAVINAVQASRRKIWQKNYAKKV